MNIVNPTSYALRQIHKFDLLNKENNQRVLIDVLEAVGQNAPFIALPHLMGYGGIEERICGAGDSVESALNDCLAKIAQISWDELQQIVGPQQT